MSSVLFTCAGTSDPVRGLRDGAMLHIMRHYRPEKIYLFLTQEIAEFEHKDQRFEKAVDYAKTHWDGNYSPELIVHNSDIRNAADLDTVNDPLQAFFKEAAQAADGEQLIINLSSGTPQMKIVLAQLSLNVQYKTLGVQVMNPEKHAGTTERTNDRSYAVEEELECNDDNQPDAPNRCVEPRMLAMHRSMQRQRLLSLLQKRDYRALQTMQDDLPPKLLQLVNHLAERNDLQLDKARKAARGLDIGFSLYPVKQGADDQYKRLSEYYLLLRNLQMTNRYSEFVVRLNPFLTHLVIRLLEVCSPVALSDYIDNPRGRAVLNAEKLERTMPDVARAVKAKANIAYLQSSDMSLFIAVPLLRAICEHTDAKQCVSDNLLDVLDACVRLNSSQRNLTAHQLYAVTAQDIINNCKDDKEKHYDAKQLITNFGHLLQFAYIDYCDTKLFTVYDRCGEYIEANL